jgi:transposase
MQTITTVGLDIAKSVFQVHGVDAGGQVIVRRQLKRRYVMTFFQKLPPCLVGIEACASAHHWSRELQALGHTVRLMPPAYVKPYVKRQKNDATDAEAICEAVTGPTTLMASLNSLQMGFRTLAIQKRSSEVWRVLAAIKTEFGKYGQVMDMAKTDASIAIVILTTCRPAFVRRIVAPMSPFSEFLEYDIEHRD